MNAQNIKSQDDISDVSFSKDLYKIKNFYNSSKINENILFEPENEQLKCQGEILEEDLKDTEKILQELNLAIQIDLNIQENDDECQELLTILRKPAQKKLATQKCKTKIKCGPFKSLKHPKKICLVGRVLSDIPSCDTQCSSNQFLPSTISTP